MYHVSFLYLFYFICRTYIVPISCRVCLIYIYSWSILSILPIWSCLSILSILSYPSYPPHPSHPSHPSYPSITFNYILSILSIVSILSILSILVILSMLSILSTPSIVSVLSYPILSYPTVPIYLGTSEVLGPLGTSFSKSGCRSRAVGDWAENTRPFEGFSSEKIYVAEL